MTFARRPVPCAVGDPVQDVGHWRVSTVAFDEDVSSVLTFTTALVADGVVRLNRYRRSGRHLGVYPKQYRRPHL
jgi:hypothetical protein